MNLVQNFLIYLYKGITIIYLCYTKHTQSSIHQECHAAAAAISEDKFKQKINL